MSRRLRVIMIVDTTVVADARVVKTGVSVQRLGHKVLVVGKRNSQVQRGNVPGLSVRLVRVVRHNPEGDMFNVARGLHGLLAYRDKESWERAERRLLESRTRAAIGEGLFSRALDKARRAWHDVRRNEWESGRAATLNRARRMTDSARHQDPRRLAANDEYWRALQPVLVDFEGAYAPYIDKFRPDVIHAHDFRMIGIAVRAAARAEKAGKKIAVIFDSHEFTAGLEGTPEFVVGNANYEAAHIRLVDRVVTVSERMADRLQQYHGLAERPLVTLNAPEKAAREGDPNFDRDIRSDCELPADTPLLVYSGGVTKRRGLEAAVEGLAFLPGVHLAIIAAPDPVGRRIIEKAARKAGTTSRVHIRDYVPRDVLIQYQRSADIAVHTMLHVLNHEVTLPNKLFDYVFAGLPMVVSDVENLSETVQKWDLGKTFVAGDPEDFARAVREALADLPRLRENVRDCPRRDAWTWESQEAVLAELYADLQAKR